MYPSASSAMASNDSTSWRSEGSPAQDSSKNETRSLGFFFQSRMVQLLDLTPAAGVHLVYLRIGSLAKTALPLVHHFPRQPGFCQTPIPIYRLRRNPQDGCNFFCIETFEV